MFTVIQVVLLGESKKRFVQERVFTSCPWPKVPSIGEFIEIAETGVPVTEVTFHLDGSTTVVVEYRSDSKGYARTQLRESLDEGFQGDEDVEDEEL